MMAGSHGNAVLVEDLCDIVGVGTLQRKADDRPLLLRRPEDAQTVNLCQAGHRPIKEGALVLQDRHAVMALQPANGGTKPDGVGNRRRTGLELVRGIRKGDVVFKDIGNHLAAAHVRRQAVEPVALGIERADA